MRLVIRLLGAEVFGLEFNEPEPPSDEVRDHTGYLVGFTASPGNQRWEKGDPHE